MPSSTIKQWFSGGEISPPPDPLREHLAKSGGIFACHNLWGWGEVLLASQGQRPEIPLKIVQCIGKRPHHKELPVPKMSIGPRNSVEKLRYIVFKNYVETEQLMIQENIKIFCIIFKSYKALNNIICDEKCTAFNSTGDSRVMSDLSFLLHFPKSYITYITLNTGEKKYSIEINYQGLIFSTSSVEKF